MRTSPGDGRDCGCSTGRIQAPARRWRLMRLKENEPLLDVRGGRRADRCGVGEPEEPLPLLPERGSRQRRHARLLEKLPLESGGAASGPGDAGEGVERTLRAQAVESGDRVQPVDDRVASPPELPDHRVHGTPVHAESGGTRHLAERRRAGVRIHLEFRDLLGQAGGHDAESEPPARHRIGLRPAVQDDRPCPHPREPADRYMLSLIEDLAVDLVGEHDRVRVAKTPGQPLEVVRGRHAPRRILRRIQDHHPRAACHLPEKLVRIEAELPFRAERNRDGSGTREPDHRLVDGKPGIRVDHLVPGLEESQHGEEDDRLGARRDHDLFGPDGNPPGAADVLGDRLAHLGQPGRRRVVGVAVGKRAVCCLDDLGRGVEVGFPELEVDDVPPLAFQLLGPGEDLEGRLGAEPAHARRESHAPPCWSRKCLK